MKLYHERQREARGELNDVYEYDRLTLPMRTHFVYFVHDILHSKDNHTEQAVYLVTLDVLCREFSCFNLIIGSEYSQNAKRTNYKKELTDFLMYSDKTEYVLSAIEYVGKNAERKKKDELNKRFREHGVGYQFEDRIIRIDNQFVHSEVVKPALSLLSDQAYAGAQEEFLSAHSHYRKGDHQEALVDAVKSIESTIKVICDKRGFPYEPNDPVRKLLQVCFDNKLIPSFWQSHMAGLRSILEGGVPTGRNKLGAHGQGADVVEVPEHLASYVLHMTASTIVFLVNAEKAMQ